MIAGKLFFSRVNDKIARSNVAGDTVSSVICEIFASVILYIFNNPDVSVGLSSRSVNFH